MASRGKKGGGKQSGDSGKAAGKNGKHAPPSSTAPKGDSAATSEGKGKGHTSETAKQQKKK